MAKLFDDNQANIIFVFYKSRYFLESDGKTMMKKILLPLVLAVLGVVSVTAQNKTCSECGIVKYNVTYPWQHHTWCPYYRPQSSGSSSGGGSVVNYGAYTAANAATSAIGALLTNALFGSRQPVQKTPEQLTRDAVAEEKERIYKEAFLKQVVKDRESWDCGDYKLDMYEYDKKWAPGRKVISLVNKKTGKNIIPVYDKKLRGTFGKETKGIYPIGSVLIYSYDDRVKFLDATKEPINPALNGCLFAQDFWYYENAEKAGRMKWKSYMGIARIVNDELQWIVKEVAYSDDLSARMAPLGKLPIIYTKHFMLNGGVTTYYAYFRGLYKDKWSWRWNLYDLKGNLKISTNVTSERDDIVQDYGDIVGVKEEIKAEDGTVEMRLKIYDADLNPHPAFKDYEQVLPRELEGIGYRFIVGGKENGYGLVDKDGNVLIPQRYEDVNTVLGYWSQYAKVSYTRWYRNEAAQYVDRAGEFEKTEHFRARMADKQLQEQYLREVMRNAEERYLVDVVENEDNVKLILGRYIADAECFPIYSSVAPWNACYLSVPMGEAENFKMSFHKMRDEAIKTVKWGIRNDAPCVIQATFTTPDGKTYQAGHGDASGA